MKGTDKVASPAPGASWTRPEAYVSALARKRSYRKAHAEKPRSQPVAPQPWLSTIPFVAILSVLAVLAVAMIFIAIPGAQPQQKPKQAAAHEVGVAQRGWFQEAQKQFHQ